MRALPLLAVALTTWTACGVNQTPEAEPPPQLPTCVPNRDGAIVADELPVPLGLVTAYYENTGARVNLAGVNGIWDFSTESAADQVAELGPEAIGGQWYAGKFPASQFVVAAGAGLAGVYHQDAQALWLDGTVSIAESPKTLVRYADPVPLLRFPVGDGDAYETVAQIPDGVVSNLPFVGTDRFEVEVAGSGRVDVPYVRFSPALRVRTRVVRTPSSGSPVVARRTTIFLFECFGEVVHAESEIDEPDADFTQAAYLRRFALGAKP
ncbi:MAG: hypothetical protein KIT31_04305 [Deltaproteobacteria bacterium]|nr:hypothetical protein [Deltaproteobacteria bacterium]